MLIHFCNHSLKQKFQLRGIWNTKVCHNRHIWRSRTEHNISYRTRRPVLIVKVLFSEGPDDSSLHSHLRENLKSSMSVPCLLTKFHT
jgi:hypothetical protein